MKRVVGKCASSPSGILKTRPKIAGQRKQHRPRDSHRNAVVNICAGVTHLRRQTGKGLVAPIVGTREAIPRQRCSQSEHRHRGWVPDRHEKFFVKFQLGAPNGRRPAINSAIGRVAGIRQWVGPLFAIAEPMMAPAACRPRNSDAIVAVQMRSVKRPFRRPRVRFTLESSSLALAAGTPLFSTGV